MSRKSWTTAPAKCQVVRFRESLFGPQEPKVGSARNYRQTCISYVRAHRNPKSVPQELTDFPPQTIISHVRAHRNPKSVPQQPTGSWHQTNISHVRAHRIPKSVPQEPTNSPNQTTISHVRAHRNPMSVPQEPIVLVDSFTNLMAFKGYPVRLL